MKQTYDSLEELMSSCSSSVLKSNVSLILRSRIIPWSFVSASTDGDICSSEFSSPIKGTDQQHHLSCRIDAWKEHWHFSTCAPGTIPSIPRAEF